MCLGLLRAGEIKRIMRRVSKARQKQNAEYRVKRKAFLKNRYCAVGILVGHFYPGVLTKNGVIREATEIHHARGRSGKMLLIERWWIPVSRQGHEWIETHRKEAQERFWVNNEGQRVRLLATAGEWLKEEE